MTKIQESTVVNINSPNTNTVKPSRTRKKTKKDSSDDEYVKPSTNRKKKPQLSAKKEKIPMPTNVKVKLTSSFDPKITQKLASANPDCYWNSFRDSSGNAIDFINAESPLERVQEADLRVRGQILGMTLSPDGSMLATFSNMGNALIWDLETYSLLQTLYDLEEENIEEYYCGRFSPDSTKIVIGGKLKNRKEWSEEDDDNHVMPCPLKVFDVLTGKVLAQFHGHDEEILSIKHVYFENEEYLLTTGQDGFIIQWQIDSDWSNLIECTKMEDGKTCMAFNASFLPNTGNKYFVASCDDGINIYDMKTKQCIQCFPELYSYYCDCVKVVDCLELEHSLSLEDVEDDSDNETPLFTYLISRGVEVLDSQDNTINSIPNAITLHKLIYPQDKGGIFTLETVRKYKDERYQSNSWLVKITSNGRYIAAPTSNGQVFLYHIASGQITGILSDHDEMEVRDVLFNPHLPFFYSCGDDGTVKVYKKMNY